MPGTENLGYFRDRGGGTNLDQNDGRGGDDRRNHGMQHHAQLAMIGIARRLMDVSYLDKGQKRQQQQAQHRGRRRKAARPAGGDPV